MQELFIVMDIISIGILAGLAILLVRKKKQPGEWFLLGFLVLFLTFIVLDLTSGESLWTWLTGMIVYMLLGPTLLGYLSHLRSETQKFPWLAHLILPAIHLCFAGVILFSSIVEETYFNGPLFYIHIFAELLYTILYSLLLMMTYQGIRLESKTADQSDATWAGILVLVYLVQMVLSFTYWFLYQVADDELILWVLDSAVSCIMILGMAIFGYRFGIFPFWPSAEPQPNSIEEEKWMRLYRDIDQLMQDESLYLNAQLRVEDLARRLKTNSRYISRAINVGSGDSVTNYLNGYRLQRFKELLADPDYQHYALDALAMECGFNSKSAFNRVFKAREGITPSTYRTRVLGK